MKIQHESWAIFLLCSLLALLQQLGMTQIIVFADYMSNFTLFAWTLKTICVVWDIGRNSSWFLIKNTQTRKNLVIRYTCILKKHLSLIFLKNSRFIALFYVHLFDNVIAEWYIDHWAGHTQSFFYLNQRCDLLSLRKLRGEGQRLKYQRIFTETLKKCF